MFVIFQRIMLVTDGLKIGTVLPRIIYLCRFYYKPKQGQTGLKIEITSHKNIGDVALLYIRKNIMVICYLLGVGAENWHYVAT